MPVLSFHCSNPSFALNIDMKRVNLTKSIGVGECIGYGIVLPVGLNAARLFPLHAMRVVAATSSSMKQVCGYFSITQVHPWPITRLSAACVVVWSCERSVTAPVLIGVRNSAPGYYQWLKRAKNASFRQSQWSVRSLQPSLASVTTRMSLSWARPSQSPTGERLPRNDYSSLNTKVIHVINNQNLQNCAQDLYS